VDNITKLNILKSNEEVVNKGNKRVNLNFAFNNIIEVFCEVIVLYRELFILKEENPIFAESSNGNKTEIDSRNEQIDEHFIKSLFNNEVGDLDLEKCKGVCFKILNKMHDLTNEQNLDLLNLKFKSKIDKYSKSIRFFLKEKIVLHGKKNENSGIGHLINFKESFEFYGRLKSQKPSGQGLKWKKKEYYLQGYFKEGKLCGFGQKNYPDGSFYR
jgi:hypothetical protein